MIPKQHTNIDLELIIVTYNSQFWLKKALLSLKNWCLDTTKYSIQVTVVDNNSTDDTIDMIRKEFSFVTFTKLEENSGFSVANNVALKKTNARYAMLLNSDIELTDDSNLDLLIEYMDKNAQVGMITPRLEFTNKELDMACHRGEPTPWASISYFMGLEKLFPTSLFFAQYHQTYKDLSVIHTIDACSGAAMMVRLSAVKKVGYLDEQFFMYAEDLDWCKRFREAGYTVVFNPEVVLIHHKNKSGIKSSSQKIARKTRTHFFDTMLQYYDKHYKQHYPSIVRTLIKYIIIMKKGAV